MAQKRDLPPTASAFAQTARFLRLPLKGGVILNREVGKAPPLIRGGRGGWFCRDRPPCLSEVHGRSADLVGSFIQTAPTICVRGMLLSGWEDTQVLPYAKRDGVVGADPCVRPASCDCSALHGCSSSGQARRPRTILLGCPATVNGSMIGTPSSLGTFSTAPPQSRLTSDAYSG